jgi:hypothetical protein
MSNIEDDFENSSDFEDEHVKDGENHSSHPKVAKLQADAMDDFRLSVEKVDVVKTEWRRLESVNVIDVSFSNKLVTKKVSTILAETKLHGLLREPHHARKSESSSSLLTDEVSDHASLKSLGEGAESPSDTYGLLLEDSRRVKFGI